MKRKNVALTGHGAMARLNRTVRTLRYYMDMLWTASKGKETDWIKLFKMAVWVFNNSSHQFLFITSTVSHQQSTGDAICKEKGLNEEGV